MAQRKGLSEKRETCFRMIAQGGMLSNAIQLAAIVASIPYIAVAP
jgi:hypothetical protein